MPGSLSTYNLGFTGRNTASVSQSLRDMVNDPNFQKTFGKSSHDFAYGLNYGKDDNPQFSGIRLLWNYPFLSGRSSSRSNPFRNSQ
jgi:hypothetical protein